MSYLFAVPHGQSHAFGGSRAIGRISGKTSCDLQNENTILLPFR